MGRGCGSEQNAQVCHHPPVAQKGGIRGFSARCFCCSPRGVRYTLLPFRYFKPKIRQPAPTLSMALVHRPQWFSAFSTREGRAAARRNADKHHQEQHHCPKNNYASFDATELGAKSGESSSRQPKRAGRRRKSANSANVKMYNASSSTRRTALRGS